MNWSIAPNLVHMLSVKQPLWPLVRTSAESRSVLTSLIFPDQCNRLQDFGSLERQKSIINISRETLIREVNSSRRMIQTVVIISLGLPTLGWDYVVVWRTNDKRFGLLHGHRICRYRSFYDLMPLWKIPESPSFPERILTGSPEFTPPGQDELTNDRYRIEGHKGAFGNHTRAPFLQCCNACAYCRWEDDNCLFR